MIADKRPLSPTSNRVAPIDNDLFNRTKSFFITNEDDMNQLSISLPLPVTEMDFNRANSTLNFADKTLPEKEVENVATKTPELDQLFNIKK